MHGYREIWSSQGSICPFSQQECNSEYRLSYTEKTITEEGAKSELFCVFHLLGSFFLNMDWKVAE